MRIARPILLVGTPVGVIFGLREAWRLAGPAMAVLMGVMIAIVSGFVWMTVQRVRSEARSASVHQPQPDQAQHDAQRVARAQLLAERHDADDEQHHRGG